MEILINSFLLVFAGEMGDKTQLLALILTVRYGRPWAVLGGIFIATLLNHALAGAVGLWIASFFSPETIKWALAVIFFGFAAWILVPDKAEDPTTPPRWGVFWTTVVAFFIAEMGDKTQLATIALAARYDSLLLVTLGTTLGMMASNALAVFLGQNFLKRVPMHWVRRVACILFVSFGIGVLLS